ncbi:MAG: molybdenum cofactor biosynthesis protein MoaE [Planctomycetia bacterium]
MRLKLRLYASLRERAGRDELVLELPGDSISSTRLRAEVERAHPELGSLEHAALVVGTDYVRGERLLAEGDDVALLPPVSGGEAGGAVDEPGLFALVAGVLRPEEWTRLVEHPSCGAVCSCVGRTRAENRGLRVVRLEYESFAAMTGPEMARIFARARAALPGAALRMVVAHKVGMVEVGAPSVVVAVASPHRDDAFRACRFLIDELKQSLPIWKKEVYADGHHWIGDRS